MPDADEIPEYLQQPASGEYPDPPIEVAEQLLPFDRLPRWEDFERLCVRLARAEPGDVDVQPFGIRGQAQSGIDIYARTEGSKRYTTYQCKRYARLTPDDIRRAVDIFVRGEWAAKSDRFVFCVTQSVRETNLAREVEAQRTRLLAHTPPVTFEVWDTEQLSAKLKREDGLVLEFFGPAWHDRFLPTPMRHRRKAGLSHRASRSGPAIPYFEDLAELARLAADKGVSASVSEIRSRLGDGHDIDGLAIAEQLAGPITRSNDWRIRRTFGLCFGHVLEDRARNDSLAPLSLGTIRELLQTDGSWPHEDVVLAIAATFSPDAARAVDTDMLKALALSDNPQALWQMARRIPALSRPDIEDLIVKRLPESRAWERRRFLTSLVMAVIFENRTLKEVASVGKHIFVAEARDGVPWLAVLVAWAHTRGVTSLGDALPQKVKRQVDEFTAGDHPLSEAERLEPNDAPDSVKTLRYWLEFESMFDHHTARLGGLSTGVLHEGYGRYWQLRDGIEHAIRLASPAHAWKVELFMELADSLDEGVRWATALALPLLDFTTHAQETLPILRKLLRDTNAWVIRETLTELTTIATENPLPRTDKFLQPVVEAALSGAHRASSAGWPEAEAGVALHAFLAAVPEAGKFAPFPPSSE